MTSRTADDPPVHIHQSTRWTNNSLQLLKTTSLRATLASFVRCWSSCFSTVYPCLTCAVQDLVYFRSRRKTFIHTCPDPAQPWTRGRQHNAEGSALDFLDTPGVPPWKTSLRLGHRPLRINSWRDYASLPAGLGLSQWLLWFNRRSTLDTCLWSLPLSTHQMWMPLFYVHKTELCVSQMSRKSPFTFILTCLHKSEHGHLFYELSSPSLQPLTIFPTQLLDFCHDLIEVVLQTFWFRIAAVHHLPNVCVQGPRTPLFWLPRDSSYLLPASPVLPLCERLLSISPWAPASSTCSWELWPPSSTEEGCQPVLVCHPLHDQLEFFLVVAFFKTARFFFTLDLDLDLRGEGEGEEEKDTFIHLLELNGTIRLTIFPKIHSSPESRSLSLSPLSNNRSGLSPSLHPLISLSTIQTLSGVLVSTVRIDLRKQDLGVCIPYRHWPTSPCLLVGQDVLLPMLPRSSEEFCTPVLRSPALGASANTSLIESSRAVGAFMPPRVPPQTTTKEPRSLNDRHTRHTSFPSFYETHYVAILSCHLPFWSLNPKP